MPPLILSDKFNLLNLSVEASRQLPRATNAFRCVINKSQTRRAVAPSAANRSHRMQNSIDV
jgi:hypothetical protein